MDEKKDQEVEVISEEQDDKKEEKKENAFSKFWKKTKQKVGDSVLEMKIESKFRTDNKLFNIYGKGELISLTVYGILEDNKVKAYGKVETEINNVLVDDETKIAYYIDSLEESTVDVVLDGVSYNRPATIINLDSDVKEVEVIKAGKKYYLQKK